MNTGTGADALNDAKVGDELMTRVAVSPSRTTYFPDQTIVISNPSRNFDIVLLRQEVAVRSQVGTVKSVDDEAVQIEFQPRDVGYEITDVAHVRLRLGPAVDMAITILNQALENHGLSRAEVEQRLHPPGVDA